jgi:hypothetical protein
MSALLLAIVAIVLPGVAILFGVAALHSQRKTKATLAATRQALSVLRGELQALEIDRGRLEVEARRLRSERGFAGRHGTNPMPQGGKPAAPLNPPRPR